jgi:hypothetical protein
MGLALLASFAHRAGTQHAIVRINEGTSLAVSFQPRPWGANWTAEHALQPDALVDDPYRDPLTADGRRPLVTTADILHLSRLVAFTFVKADETSSHKANGTATFEFYWAFLLERILLGPTIQVGEVLQRQHSEIAARRSSSARCSPVPKGLRLQREAVNFPQILCGLARSQARRPSRTRYRLIDQRHRPLCEPLRRVSQRAYRRRDVRVWRFLTVSRSLTSSSAYVPCRVPAKKSDVGSTLFF